MRRNGEACKNKQNNDKEKTKNTGMSTEIFQAFEARIEELDRSLQKLRALMDRIQKNASAFDDEDQQLVMSKIRAVEDEKRDLKMELEKRENMYENTVKRMEQALLVRMDILQQTDSETGVLEDNPDLMEQFVQKQSQLTTMLQEMKDKLAAPLPSSASAPPPEAQQ